MTEATHFVYFKTLQIAVKTARAQEVKVMLLLRDAQKTKKLALMTFININKYRRHTLQASKSWISFG